MKDKQFLAWMHERIVHQYGESPNVDFLWRLRAIIQNVPEDADASSPLQDIMSARRVTEVAGDFCREGVEVDPESPS